mgnify:CR=1 FL=1
MEMRENMPGILFQSVERARKQAIQTEFVTQGVGDTRTAHDSVPAQGQGREGRIAAQKELSDAMHVSPATVAVSLKSLEREGYVEKLADETDQRRKAVRLTPKGEAAIQRCVQVFEAVDQSMFEGFRPEETRQACGYLMRMLHNLRGDLPPERMNCQC